MSMINQLGDPSIERRFYVLSRQAGRNATEYVVMDRTTGARAEEPAVFDTGSEAQQRADRLENVVVPVDAVRTETESYHGSMVGFWSDGPATSVPVVHAADRVDPVKAREHAEAYGRTWASMNPTEQAAQSTGDSPPAEPEPGTVVGFTKRFREDGPGYAYVAIRIKGRGWYTTGRPIVEPATWAELLKFVDGADLWVTRDWTRLS